MIEIASNTDYLTTRALDADGGFAWWYVDLLDDQGNGLVCIWSFGLPFLPDSRRGGPAWLRPSVNLAVYREGRRVLYLLQQHERDALGNRCSTGAARIGESRFEIEEGDGEVALRIDLDEAMPGTHSRLRAEIEIVGSSLVLDPPSRDANHVWTPRLVHAHGRARVTLDGRSEDVIGVGYFDGNASTLPLHAQGIESWRWARLTVLDRSFVVYDVSGSAAMTQVIEANRGGIVRGWPSPARFEEPHRSVFGLRSPRRIELDLDDEHLVGVATHLLDDGPFYQRFLVRVSNPERPSVEGVGMYETVYPNRLDLGWQRPFVRMRTHRVGRENSPWLPLFCGWSGSRGRRLLAGFAERLGHAPFSDRSASERWDRTP